MSRMIFFLDLDGTLLQDDKNVSKEDYDALHWAMEQGHCIAITTGRPVTSTQKIIDKLGLNVEGAYMVCCNGASAYDCYRKELLYDHRVSLEHARYLYEEAKKSGIYLQTYAGDKVVTDHDCEEIRFYCKRINMECIITEDIWDVVTEDPIKCLMINLHTQEPLRKFQKEHARWQNGKVNAYFSCQQFLEYAPLTASKGAAVHLLSDRLGIPMSGTCAIGDAENDLSMIEEAEYGVAMANAIDIVKAAANIVTEHDNNHSGVAETIYRLCKAR